MKIVFIHSFTCLAQHILIKKSIFQGVSLIEHIENPLSLLKILQDGCCIFKVCDSQHLHQLFYI